MLGQSSLGKVTSLFIVIPAYNEAKSLGATISELPCQLPGVKQIRILVADDGSTDETAAVAVRAGADVLRLPKVGLAQTYKSGLSAALNKGADIIITLDADGQYDPSGIQAMVDQLCSGRTDIVLAQRDRQFYSRMRPLRRFAHRLGAWVVRLITRLNTHDPITGYRGYTRSAAAKLGIKSRYTYTLETLVQIPLLGLKLEMLVIPSRETRRASRLFRHPLSYISRQATTLIWAVIYYKFKYGWRFSERLWLRCHSRLGLLHFLPNRFLKMAIRVTSKHYF